MTLAPEYGLRLYQEGDEVWLSRITLAAIREVGARHYSPEQVDAWAAGNHSPESLKARAEAGAHIPVAIAGIALPVAYALLEFDEAGHGHLDRLYCHGAHTRKGLAEALLEACEAHAREIGAPRLYTEASELARPAFERAGFTVLQRRDFAIEGPDGREVAIHNYAMEKRLNTGTTT